MLKCHFILSVFFTLWMKTTHAVQTVPFIENRINAIAKKLFTYSLVNTVYKSFFIKHIPHVPYWSFLQETTYSTVNEHHTRYSARKLQCMSTLVKIAIGESKLTLY